MFFVSHVFNLNTFVTYYTYVCVTQCFDLLQRKTLYKYLSLLLFDAPYVPYELKSVNHVECVKKLNKCITAVHVIPRKHGFHYY